MTAHPRFRAGDPIPFTPAELTELLRPYAQIGDVITADLLNRAIERAQADGTLPPNIQERLDNYAAKGQPSDVASAWRAQSRRGQAGTDSSR